MRIESPSRLRAICQSGKELDPAWYFVHRRWSIYLTWGFLHTRLTPNHISLLMMNCLERNEIVRPTVRLRPLGNFKN